MKDAAPPGTRMSYEGLKNSPVRPGGKVRALPFPMVCKKNSAQPWVQRLRVWRLPPRALDRNISILLAGRHAVAGVPRAYPSAPGPIWDPLTASHEN